MIWQEPVKVVKSPWLSTTEYRSYLPTSKAMAFRFKILIQMRFLSTDKAIWIYAFWWPMTDCIKCISRFQWTLGDPTNSWWTATGQLPGYNKSHYTTSGLDSHSLWGPYIGQILTEGPNFVFGTFGRKTFQFWESRPKLARKKSFSH